MSHSHPVSGPNERGPQSSEIDTDALASLIASGQSQLPSGLPSATAVTVLRLVREKRRQALMTMIARLLARNQIDSA